MDIDEIVIRRGHLVNEDIGSFGVVYAGQPDGQPVTVRLSVGTEEEHHYDLHPGDTFPVRDQVWKLDRVEDLQTRSWRVVLVRVHQPS